MPKSSDIEKWLAYFSKTTTPEELEAIAMTEPLIQKALTNEVLFTTDQIVRRSYEKAETINLIAKYTKLSLEKLTELSRLHDLL